MQGKTGLGWGGGGGAESPWPSTFLKPLLVVSSEMMPGRSVCLSVMA